MAKKIKGFQLHKLPHMRDIAKGKEHCRKAFRLDESYNGCTSAACQPFGPFTTVNWTA